MNIHPFPEFVLVEHIAPEKTDSGLHLPDSARYSAEPIGIVRAVGDNCEPIIPGNKVVFIKSAANPVTIDGRELYFFKKRSILAVYDSPPELYNYYWLCQNAELISHYPVLGEFKLSITIDPGDGSYMDITSDEHLDLDLAITDIRKQITELSP